MAREICIRGPNGKMYCTSSPIRDCGCDRKSDYQDPFPALPRVIDEASFASDLAQLVRSVSKSADPEEWNERLRVILVTARLMLLPEVKIMEPFVILSMDAHVPDSASPSAQ